MSSVPPGYGLWSNEYVDGLRRERDDLIAAIRDLLASSDASWYERHEGHDWREAVDAANRVLDEPKGGPPPELTPRQVAFRALPHGGYRRPEDAPSITCPDCGLTSYHPGDIAERYCANCHRFHDGSH